MMTVVTKTERNDSYVDNWQLCETRNSAAEEIECVFSKALQSLAKFYRNNISLQDERRQLTVAASKGRLDYKTSTVIREQEEEMLNILELPVSNS